MKSSSFRRKSHPLATLSNAFSGGVEPYIETEPVAIGQKINITTDVRSKEPILFK